MTTEIKQEEVLMYHEQWLQQPAATQLRHILSKHIDAITERIIAVSSDFTVEGDKQLRDLATQLKTTKTIVKLIYDSKSFVSKVCTE